MPTQPSAILLDKVGLIEDERTTYVDSFVGLPLLKAAADLNATFANAEIEATQSSNLVWEVSGGGAVAPTRSTGGGITLTTGTSSGNETYLGGHTGTGGNQYLSTVDWSTDDEIAFYAKIKTSSAIDAQTLFAGYKLTFDPTVATDDDQVFLRYQDSQSSGNFEFVYSVGGTDTTIDTGVSVSASTTYELYVDVDSDRLARAYINVDGGGWEKVATSTALTTGVDLLPFIGIETNEAAANAVTVRKVALGKTDND